MCLTDNTEVSFYSQASCVSASATYDGVTGLYFGAPETAGITYIRAEGGGNLFAEDDVTPNEKSGFSARYGRGYPWTYSFWFYPNAETTIGAEATLFLLGYSSSQTGRDNRVALRYNDTDGTFHLEARNNSGVISGTEWCGYAEPQKWHHIVVTCDDTARTFSLYIDGIFIASTTLASGSSPATNYANPYLILGGIDTRWGKTYAAIGCQSCFRWYNGVLS